MAVGLAAAKEIHVAAAVAAALLSELDSVFTFKEHPRMALKAVLGGNMFSVYSQHFL